MILELRLIPTTDDEVAADGVLRILDANVCAFFFGGSECSSLSDEDEHDEEEEEDSFGLKSLSSAEKSSSELIS